MICSSVKLNISSIRLLLLLYPMDHFLRSAPPFRDDWKPPLAVLELPKLSMLYPSFSEPTLPYLERVSLSLRRAQAIVRAYSKSCLDKFLNLILHSRSQRGRCGALTIFILGHA